MDCTSSVPDIGYPLQKGGRYRSINPWRCVEGAIRNSNLGNQITCFPALPGCILRSRQVLYWFCDKHGQFPRIRRNASSSPLAHMNNQKIDPQCVTAHQIIRQRFNTLAKDFLIHRSQIGDRACGQPEKQDLASLFFIRWKRSTTSSSKVLLSRAWVGEEYLCTIATCLHSVTVLHADLRLLKHELQLVS